MRQFCQSDLGAPHCQAGRVRILRLSELEAFGPFFARYLGARLWRGENFYMQVDSHTGFRSGWDSTLVEMIKLTPTYPMSVISNYPESGQASDEKEWPAFEVGESTPEALCNAGAGGTVTVRLDHTSRNFPLKQFGLSVPRRSCFVAAGFYIAHGSIVDEVPYDPFLPFIFMGEEIALSHRLWTSGYDIYAPSANVLRHEYGREDQPKFWETVNAAFSVPTMYNDLSDLITQRIQHYLGFPEAKEVSDVSPPSLLDSIDSFSTGRFRSGHAFAKACGIDYGARVQTA
eukprot:CAMPEP_0170626034 /NCGR_PEP_ID=MMETSP0224-20130122/31113_1 /TAXON_ID=285029 /ORGANISM="Togula jolla, Strain CCCM 725" /LENGTH=286 /DNA_ID=CAMNT_0010952721 /DNA_START=245 /DNA_END=1102 /DNA_ORIENTATION=+